MFYPFLLKTTHMLYEVINLAHQFLLETKTVLIIQLLNHTWHYITLTSICCICRVTKLKIKYLCLFLLTQQDTEVSFLLVITDNTNLTSNDFPVYNS